MRRVGESRLTAQTLPAPPPQRPMGFVNDRARTTAPSTRIVGPMMLLILLAAGALFLTGCTRPFFRNRADSDVHYILNEKDNFSAWELFDYNVYPHPLARFADPTNPDRPPMPPDDPAAWLLSPRAQKPKEVAYIEGTGYYDLLRRWDEENRSRQALEKAATEALAKPNAPPAAPSVLEEPRECVQTPLLECPTIPNCPSKESRLCALQGRTDPFLITFEQAVELGVLNSREFQSRREDLYLAALPVSLQRFGFMPQFEATNNTIREWAGRQSAIGKENSWTSGTGLGVSQLFSTGALLMAQFANQTIVNLTGNQPHTLSQSTLSLDLVQPFLRGGGRAVTLEPLTQAERDLLYEVRSFARFHREFFVSIAGGRGLNGYLQVLQTQALLQNQEANIRRLQELYTYYRALADGGDFSQLQVDQVELTLLQAQTQIVVQQANFGDAMDQFKLLLGIPPDVPLVLDDGPIRPIRAQLERFEAIEAGYRKLMEGLEEKELTPDLPMKYREHIRQMFASDYVQGTRFQQRILERWAFWQQLGDGARARWREEILKFQELEREADKFEEAGNPVPDELRTRMRQTKLDYELGRLETYLRQYEKQGWQVIQLPAARELEKAKQFRLVYNQVGVLLSAPRDEKLEVWRGQWPVLPPLCLHGQDLTKLKPDEAHNLAGQTALVNRLDLMNQRAQLVDAWRQLAVTANALLGTFDLRYHMEVLTPPAGVAQPFDFDGKRARHQLILNTELPLVRRLERNNYRAAIINYQRQRRAYMLAEDTVLTQIRSQLRNLKQLAETYRIQQKSVPLSYFRLDNSLETLRAPANPSEAARGAAAAAASLTQNILDAYNSLPQTQNQLYASYINYVTARMALYRDLELLRVDARGVWIDEFASPDCSQPVQCGNVPPAPIAPDSR